MRPGAEYFVVPAEPAQRRYEALRAYFVEGLAAAEARARFGYSAATMHQLASDLRAGRVALFVSAKPGPKGPRTALRVRDRVLELRAADRSVTEIAAALTAAGTPVTSGWSGSGAVRNRPSSPSASASPPRTTWPPRFATSLTPTPGHPSAHPVEQATAGQYGIT